MSTSDTDTNVVSEPIWFQSQRTMSLGLMLPVGEASHFGETPRFSDMVEMARVAREVGFEAIWLADHFSFTEAETGDVRGVWECWTMMAAVAAEVPDVQVGSLVACTGFRNPGVIAKMTESIDEISGGRFILGLGAGWHEPEYDQFGFPFDHRVSRFDDAISIIHPLLREGRADYQGRFFQANGAVNRPRGPRESGAPILVGSSGDRMLGLIARYADAWNTVWHSDSEAVKPLMEKVDAACDEAGRDPKSLIRTAGGNFAMEGYLERRPNAIKGDTDTMAERLNGFRDLGLSHFVCGLDPCTPETIRSFEPVVKKFDATE
ncbi:MAG TPA: LLM class flavin-dependent oxidoreductase [Thermomicrobiales bacterium]|nr:LLM class flavin-dependent oxidoreductase [Thermomicrobiales bacterium]